MVIMFFKYITHQSNIINRFGHESLIVGDLVLTLGGGGGKNGFIRELEILNLKTNEVKKLSLDLPRSDDDEDNYDNSLLASFKMTFIDNINQVLIFGGINEANEFNSNLMILQNLKSLKIIQASGDNPSARIGHSFTKINNQKVILFGGVENSLTNPSFCNDIYILHINALELRWEKLLIDGLKPSPRESHSAVLYENVIVIFGGMNGQQRLNDTWTFDINTNRFEKMECSGFTPTARSLHTANVSNDTMYIYGGFVCADYKTWSCTSSFQCLNLDTMTWKNSANIELINKKSVPRASHSSFEHYGRIYFWCGRKDSSLTKQSEEGDCWYIETRPPTPVAEFQMLFAGFNSITVKFSKTFNAVCYLIEIREPQLDKRQNIVKIEVDEPPSTILVRKVNKIGSAESSTKKKIVINDRKVLAISKINQIDGASDDKGSETESADSEESHAYGQWCFVKMAFNHDPVVIGSYFDYKVDRNVTSVSLPKITNYKQIQVKPRKTYQVRVSAINSSGMSCATEPIAVKTASVQTLTCLRLETVTNMKEWLFSWKSTVFGMDFVVVLLTTFKTHINYSTIYKGKKNSCTIQKEIMEQNEATEYVLQVSIMIDDKVKVCENEFRWKIKKEVK